MFKCKFQEFCQRNGWELPEYGTVKRGPQHMPRFTATVKVHGHIFETPDKCKSGKEAQNKVAEIALEHLTAPSGQTVSPLSVPGASPPARVNSPSDTSPIIHSVAQSVGNQDVSSLPLSPLPSSLPVPPPDTFPIYKNRLQQYAQKHNLGFPLYTNEVEGPPHARNFKAKVSLDGKSYETLEFFPTLKEAEQAAAKIACEMLSVDGIQEDAGLYKNLLRELAQKQGLRCPSYDTVILGMSHVPVFVSTVEIGKSTFKGTECKTKKQAETNAAKVAYHAFAQGSPATESSNVSPSSEHVTDNLKQEIHPTVTPITDNDEANEETQIHAKKAKCLPQNVDAKADLSGLFPPATKHPADYSKFIAHVPPPSKSGVKWKTKIMIVPRKAGMILPERTVKRHNERWVAYQFDLDENEKPII